METKTFTVDQFIKAIIVPAFADLTPDMPYESSLFDWTPIDLKGRSSTTLLNLKRTGNILQRRDASCDLNYKKLMGTTQRKITADELYAAVRQCNHAFYQGALKDLRANDPIFARNITPFFQQAFRQDIVTNSYFGSLNRAANPDSEFSTTMFDGALEWLKKYSAAGVIPSSQSFAISDVDLRQNPSTALAVLDSAFEKQNTLMRNMPAGIKAYYVSQNIVDGVAKYYRSVGQSTLEIVGQYQNGVKVYAHNDIVLLVEPMFEPVLAEISGKPNAAFCILTLRGNFNYAYDSLYGEGEDMKTALMVWYEKKELAWYYQAFMKGGVQIGLPEHTVYGITSF